MLAHQIRTLRAKMNLGEAEIFLPELLGSHTSQDWLRRLRNTTLQELAITKKRL